MNIQLWVKQIRSKEFFFAFFDVFFLVTSAMPALFVFEKQFFLSTDWIKLLLLSGAMTAPIMFLNTIGLSALEDDVTLKKKDGLFFAMTMAALSTTIFLNGPLVAIYGMGWSLKSYMIMVGLLEFILLGWSMIYAKWFKKPREVKEKTKKKAAAVKESTA